jgi:hypothetical protein
MTETARVLTISLILIMSVTFLTVSAFSQPAQKTMYIGGAFALTSPPGEDSTHVLLGFQDYAKYVNIIAPWYLKRNFRPI